jgi:hypothetical protein
MRASQGIEKSGERGSGEGGKRFRLFLDLFLCSSLFSESFFSFSFYTDINHKRGALKALLQSIKKNRGSEGERRR